MALSTSPDTQLSRRQRARAIAGARWDKLRTQIKRNKSVKNLMSMPGSLGAAGFICAAAYNLNTTLGLFVSGVALWVLELLAADET